MFAGRKHGRRVAMENGHTVQAPDSVVDLLIFRPHPELDPPQPSRSMFKHRLDIIFSSLQPAPP